MAQDFFSGFSRLRLATAASSPGVTGARPASSPGPHSWLAAEGDDDQGPTVEAQRRRRGEPGADRERAEAPHRRQPDEQSQPVSAPRDTSGGGGGLGDVGGGGGGGAQSALISLFQALFKRNPLLAIGLLVLVGLCVVCVMLFGGGMPNLGEVGQTPPTPESFAPEPAFPDTPTPKPAAVRRNTPTPEPAAPAPAPASSNGQKWLVMLYQDADDKILEEDIFTDLNEAERVGSSDRVQIVAQLDRFKGGFKGDGDWTTAKRFYLTQDNDLKRINSEEVADLGEVNMSDGQKTLVDFVSWAAQTYPADKYVLILSDHGMGWPGGWSDADPGPRGSRDVPNIPLASAIGDDLYLMELDQALETIHAQTSIKQFELIGMDACLMSHLEVFAALAPYARYAVASQETEPALGWAYTGFLKKLKANPDLDGAALGQLIVQSYIQDDQRIVDDQARADFLRQGAPLGGLFGSSSEPSAEQLAQEMEQDVTLTAVDLAALPGLLDSVNNFSFALQSADQSIVARARTYAQSFTNIFGKDVPPPYIDLGHSAMLLQRKSGHKNVTQAADGVLAAMKKAVIAEKHGTQKPGATGISIYFPNSQLYESPMAGPESYTAIARRFADESLWDEFLAYHYTQQPFEPTTRTVAVPKRGTAIRAPGAGQIEASSLTLSAKTAAPGKPVTLQTTIRGQNVGYVYLLVGFYDQASNSIFVADSDYLESAKSREINGVYYPDWGANGQFTLKFKWDPVVFAISDGKKSVTALFNPQTYGVSFKDAIYTVEGLYTYADDGATRPARLYFSDGKLRQVFGFTGEGDTAAPREIIPQNGDTFTLQEKWLDLDKNGQVTKTATQTGDTLTFGDQPFTWKELDAAAGEYIVGLIVSDLDGNSSEVYDKVTVE